MSIRSTLLTALIKKGTLLATLAGLAASTLVQAQFYSNTFETTTNASITQERVGLLGGVTTTAYNLDGPKDWEVAALSGGLWYNETNDQLNLHAIGTGASVNAPAAVRTGGSGTKTLFFNDWNSGRVYRQQRRFVLGTMNLSTNPDGNAATVPFVKFYLYHESVFASTFAVLRLKGKLAGGSWKTLAVIPSGGKTGDLWAFINVPVPPAYRVAGVQLALDVVNEKNDDAGNAGAYSAGKSNIYVDDLQVYEFNPNATVITSAAATEWNLPTTWVGGVVPNASNSVVIAHAVTNTTQAVIRVQNLTINGGFTYTHSGNPYHVAGNLVINASADLRTRGRFYLLGNITNNGAWYMGNNATPSANTNGAAQGAAQLYFGGGALQTFGGSGTMGTDPTYVTVGNNYLNGIAILNPAGVFMNHAIRPVNQLLLKDGDITAATATTVTLGGDNAFNGTPNTYNIDVLKGRLNTPFVWGNRVTSARNVNYEYDQQADLTPENVVGGYEASLQGGTGPTLINMGRNTGGQLRDYFGSVTQSQPCVAGTIGFQRGIFISDPVNYLAITNANQDLTPIAPSYTNNITNNHGSYVAGSVRMAASGNGTVGFPLGSGSTITSTNGTDVFTSTNAARKLSIASGATGFTASTVITAALTASPSGSGETVRGNKAFSVSTTLALPATSTATLSYAAADNIVPPAIAPGALIVAKAALLNGGTYVSASAGSTYAAPGTVTTNATGALNASNSFVLAFAASGPPACATTSPVDQSTNILTTSAINFSSPTGPAPTSYDVFFGTSASPAFVINQAAGPYTPSLAAGTSYYYKIVPKNSFGAATSCPVVKFTTSGTPCAPGDWIGVASTNGLASANYCGGAGPNAGTTIRVRSGAPYMPTYPGGETFAGLQLEPGTTVTFSGTTNFSGNIVNNGGTFAGAGNMRIIGGTPTTFSGMTTSISAIEVAKGGSGSFTLNTPLNLTGTMTLSDGQLVTNGNLTLVSVQGKTGRIGTITGTGSLSGNVNVQRKIEGNTAGWYLLGATNTGQTMNDFNELQPVVSPKNNASAFFYSESDSNSQFLNGVRVERFGWKTMTAGQAMPVGQGFRFYARARFFSGAGGLVTTTGPVATTTQTVSTPNSGPNSYDAGGWNLIANPLPSEVDFNALAKSGINNAAFRWNGSTKRYEVYVGGGGSAQGVSVNSPGPNANVIAQGQAFFVKRVGTGGGSVGFTEASKVNATHTFFREAAPKGQLRITMLNATGSTDETIVRFVSDATLGNDVAYDAPKLDGNYFNVGTMVGGKPYAVNTLPALVSTQTVPVMTNYEQLGRYQLRFTELNSFEDGARVWIKDNYLGTMMEISEGGNYAYEATADPASLTNRFELSFMRTDKALVPNVPQAAGFRVYPNPANGGTFYMAVIGGADEASQITITDAAGRVTFKGAMTLPVAGEGVKLELSGYERGMYLINCVNGGTTYRTRLVVE